MAGWTDMFSGMGGGGAMGSQAEWGNFDTADFDSISNEGIGNSWSNFGNKLGAGFTDRNGIMDGMLSGGQQQQPQQGGMQGSAPSMQSMNVQQQPWKRSETDTRNMNPYLLELLKSSY